MLLTEDARFGSIYNVQQALISIGSGGWFGQGYESGSQVQLRFLKVRHSDFIFSALSQEFGFAGANLCYGLLFFIIWRCFRAARLAADTFGALICYGVATLVHFSGGSQYWHESEPVAGYRFGLTICQLWGQFVALDVVGYWLGGECYSPPQSTRILIRF